MKVYFASDHAGFEMKNKLIDFVRGELSYEVEDCGAFVPDPDDDFNEFVRKAALAVSENPKNRKAIILGGSGQGEAIAANRFKYVRAVVFYGEPRSEQTDASGETLGMLDSTRRHNDANILSLGARFLSVEDAKKAAKVWLETEFKGEERHIRRIASIDE